jgi:hypothetical protein
LPRPARHSHRNRVELDGGAQRDALIGYYVFQGTTPSNLTQVAYHQRNLVYRLFPHAGEYLLFRRRRIRQGQQRFADVDAGVGHHPGADSRETRHPISPSSPSLALPIDPVTPGTTYYYGVESTDMVGNVSPTSRIATPLTKGNHIRILLTVYMK